MGKNSFKKNQFFYFFILAFKVAFSLRHKRAMRIEPFKVYFVQIEKAINFWAARPSGGAKRSLGLLH